MFVRIGTFQWVAAIPNKKNPDLSQALDQMSQSDFPLCRSRASGGHRFDPPNGKVYTMSF
jgi:hypothetical protein